MHVAELLQALLVGEDVHRIIPPIGAGSYKSQLARVEDAVVAGHRVRVWLRTEPQASGADLARKVCASLRNAEFRTARCITRLTSSELHFVGTNSETLLRLEGASFEVTPQPGQPLKISLEGGEEVFMSETKHEVTPQ
jgi:hypothetical protein